MVGYRSDAAPQAGRRWQSISGAWSAAHAGNPPKYGVETGKGASDMTVGIGHYLTPSAILFTDRRLRTFLNRKNVIVIMMSIELLLLAANINLVAFSSRRHDLMGQDFVLLC